MSDGVEFRRATEADFQAVVDIDHNIYNGSDIVKDRYKSWMLDPRRRALVALKDGKVIGFLIGFVVDNGESLIGQAARLHPNYRSFGIWRWFARNIIYSGVFSDFQLKRLVWTTSVGEMYLTKIRQGSAKYKHISRENHFYTVINTESDDESGQPTIKIPDHLRSHTLKKLTRFELLEVLKGPENQARWFPDGRLIVSCEPYRLYSSNFKIIADTMADEIYCTQSRNKALPVCQSLSIGNVYQTKNGLRYDVDYYGNDVLDAVTHYYHQVACTVKYLRHGKFSSGIFTPLWVDAQQLKQTIYSFPGIQHSNGPPFCDFFEGEFANIKTTATPGNSPEDVISCSAFWI